MATPQVRQRVNFVAATDAERAASEEEKRDVRAEAGRNFDESWRGDPLSGEPQKAEERRGSIARSAAQAAAHRNALGQHRAHAVLNSNFAGELIESAIDQIIRAGLTGELDLPSRRRRRGPIS